MWLSLRNCQSWINRPCWQCWHFLLWVFVHCFQGHSIRVHIYFKKKKAGGLHKSYNGYEIYTSSSKYFIFSVFPIFMKGASNSGRHSNSWWNRNKDNNRKDHSFIAISHLNLFWKWCLLPCILNFTSHQYKNQGWTILD